MLGMLSDVFRDAEWLAPTCDTVNCRSDCLRPAFVLNNGEFRTTSKRLSDGFGEGSETLASAEPSSHQAGVTCRRRSLFALPNAPSVPSAPQSSSHLDDTVRRILDQRVLDLLHALTDAVHADADHGHDVVDTESAAARLGQDAELALRVQRHRHRAARKRLLEVRRVQDRLEVLEVREREAERVVVDSEREGGTLVGRVLSVS